MPAISVIIPTWNWSAALRVAITSVLNQTERDFELLVIGDCCTDDSADVVASFGDRRIRWHNLAANHGSQWAADNAGLDLANGEWIAYLGHDDLWYPTHLAAILRAAREAPDAAIVTSVMIMYGPPGTGVRSVAGIFADATMTIADVVPPSALAHRRSLTAGGAIRWREPAGQVLPVDVVFQRELFEAAPRAASTHEVTCFKFNAAWRRDAYLTRSAGEQQAMLERINSGADFRQRELLDVLEAIESDRFIRITAPATDGLAPGAHAHRNRRIKGLERRFAADAVASLDEPRRFDLADQDTPFEWHGLEPYPDDGTFRWSGPGRRATIDLPVHFDRDLEIDIRVVNALTPQALDGLVVSIHGYTIPSTILRDADGAIVRANARLADCRRRCVSSA